MISAFTSIGGVKTEFRLHQWRCAGRYADRPRTGSLAACVSGTGTKNTVAAAGSSARQQGRLDVVGVSERRNQEKAATDHTPPIIGPAHGRPVSTSSWA